MRLFQSAGFGLHYLQYFNSKKHLPKEVSFSKRLEALLEDRYGATHILKPVYDGDSNTFFTVSDDSRLQISWAREKGMPSTDLTEILLAQIEEAKSEVVYQLDPVRFPSSFVRRLPGCVKKSIAWRASVNGPEDFSSYDLVVSNFKFLNDQLAERGCRTTLFSPSWDPAMGAYSSNLERSTDVFFTGSYVRNGHGSRLEFLHSVARLAGHAKVDLRILSKKWGRLSTLGLGRWVPIPNHIPKALADVSGSPVFGLEMYTALSKAKIVINPATDIAGDERGNMRCWEALGCGACMLGSAGSYPEGFYAGMNFDSFTDSDDLMQKVRNLLNDEPRRAAMAKCGADMVARVWSKERQWDDFQSLLASL